jgi:hypothetical protein
LSCISSDQLITTIRNNVCICTIFMSNEIMVLSTLPLLLKKTTGAIVFSLREKAFCRREERAAFCGCSPAGQSAEHATATVHFGESSGPVNRHHGLAHMRNFSGSLPTPPQKNRARKKWGRRAAAVSGVFRRVRSACAPAQNRPPQPTGAQSARALTFRLFPNLSSSVKW